MKKTDEILKEMVISYAQDIEQAASGDYEELAEMLENVYDVKITIDGNLRYDSVKVALAVGGPSIYFDTATSTVEGYWGCDSFEYGVSSFAVEEVDEYFEEYYNCR